MNSLLNNINELDELIRRHHKMESKMRSGQFIDAYRDLGGILAFLNRSKQKLIENAEKKDDK